jgi:hypothetical protein
MQVEPDRSTSIAADLEFEYLLKAQVFIKGQQHHGMPLGTLMLFESYQYVAFKPPRFADKITVLCY